MKKLIGIAITMMLSALAPNAMAGNIYPTQGVLQELAGTIGVGEVSVDLVNTTEYRSHVRIGLPTDGELIYDITDSRLGYKHLFNRSIAGYALLALDSDRDADTVIGVAYSGRTEKFQYNINAEVLLPAGDGNTETDIRAGIYFPMNTKYLGRIQLIGEVTLNSADDSTGLYGAVRFSPNENFRADVGVFVSSDAESSVGLPLFFRLTFKM
jgi:hypothetical protein